MFNKHVKDACAHTDKNESDETIKSDSTESDQECDRVKDSKS